MDDFTFDATVPLAGESVAVSVTASGSGALLAVHERADRSAGESLHGRLDDVTVERLERRAAGEAAFEGRRADI